MKKILIPIFFTLLKGLQMDFLLVIPKWKINRQVLVFFILFLLLLALRGFDLYGFYGVLKLILPLTILFSFEKRILTSFFCLNIIFSLIQLFTANTSFWSLYTEYLNWGNSVGIRDGVVGLLANRSYNAVLLLLSLLYFKNNNKRVLAFLSLLLIPFTNNLMSIVVLLVWISIYLYTSNRTIFFILCIVSVLMIINVYPEIKGGINIESRSVIQRLDSFDLFMSTDSLYKIFFGSKITLLRAVDSQYLLLIIRHGILATGLYYILLFLSVRNYWLISMILLYSVTFPITYNPIIYFLIYSVNNDLQNPKEV